MKRLLIVVCFIVSNIPVLFAQNEYADSLLNVLNTQKLTLAEEIEIYYSITESYAAVDMKNTYVYAMKGLGVARKANNKIMISVFYGYIASTYVYRTSYDTAYMYMQKQLEIIEGLQNKYMLHGWYFGIGNIYARQGLFDKAVENYLKSMAIYQEKISKEVDQNFKLKAQMPYTLCNPVRTYILSLGNTGECYRRLNNPERAMHYLNQAREIIETDGVNRRINCQSQVYRELGYVYFSQGDIDKALEFQMKVLNLPGGLNQVAESDCKEALIKIHIIKEEYDKALEYAHDCLRLAESLGDPFIDVLAWNSFADIYKAQGRYKECESAAMNAWNIDSTSIDTAPISAYNIAYANLFLGNKEKAVLFFKKNEELNLQKNNKDYQEALANMEIKYETESKEIKINILEKEKQLYVWLSVACILALVMFIGVLSYWHRLNVERRKLAEEQVKQLEQKQKLIAAQALLDGETTERSRLARDLHDGLGGMLSAIKLSLKDVERSSQTMKILDESIKELRLIAHHMMPESLMRYGLKVSLEDFCRVIPTAQFQYLGGDCRLDSRLEVMIYRCAYELLNNAIKYGQASNIHVQLLVDDGVVALTVQDNGVGFDPDKIASGTGLKNIQARVSIYNGKINIRTAPGKGTEVSIEIESI